MHQNLTILKDNLKNENDPKNLDNLMNSYNYKNHNNNINNNYKTNST